MKLLDIIKTEYINALESIIRQIIQERIEYWDTDAPYSKEVVGLLRSLDPSIILHELFEYEDFVTTEDFLSRAGVQIWTSWLIDKKVEVL